MRVRVVVKKIAIKLVPRRMGRAVFHFHWVSGARVLNGPLLFSRLINLHGSFVQKHAQCTRSNNLLDRWNLEAFTCVCVIRQPVEATQHEEQQV